MGPVVFIVGARPNLMKIAPILRALASRPARSAGLLVHTGQHHDVAVSGVLRLSPAAGAPIDGWDGRAAERVVDVLRDGWGA